MFTGIVEARGTVEELEPKGSVQRVVFATDLPVEELPLGASIAVDGVCLTVIERSPGRFAADLGPETLAVTTLSALAVGTRVHLERALKLGDALGGHLVSGHVEGIGHVVARNPQGDALELKISAPAEVAPSLVVKGSVTVDGVSLTINRIEGAAARIEGAAARIEGAAARIEGAAARIEGAAARIEGAAARIEGAAAGVEGEVFSVTLIPHTLAVTGLGEKAVGAAVNLEGDQVAKHVARLVDAALDARFGAATDEKRITPPLAPPAPARPSGLTLETLRKHGFAR